MKASELIYELNKMIRKHGDLPVILSDTGGVTSEYYDLDDVQQQDVYTYSEAADEDAPYYDDDGKGNLEMIAITPITKYSVLKRLEKRNDKK